MALISVNEGYLNVSNMLNDTSPEGDELIVVHTVDGEPMYPGDTVQGLFEFS